MEGIGQGAKIAVLAMKMLSLKCVLLAQVSLMPCVAFGSDKPVFCELEKKSIVSRSSAGVAQVSNLGDIQITCHVPPRPFPTKPGESRNALRVSATVYKVSQDGSKKLVRSEALVTGGGFTPNEEFSLFHLNIPLDQAEREAEAQRLYARMEDAMPQLREGSEESRRKAVEGLAEFVSQHRVGRFLVECRVLDEERVLGVGSVELEVLFKGRFSDVGLPAAPTA
jgi:hypothetical protein